MNCYPACVGQLSYFQVWDY